MQPAVPYNTYPITRHLCEHAIFLVTETQCRTSKCNRFYTLTTTTEAPPEVNATWCNSTACYIWNGTHWVYHGNNTTPAMTTLPGGGTGHPGGHTTLWPAGWTSSGRGGKGAHKHHEHVHKKESNRSVWSKIRKVLAATFGTGIVLVLFCCFYFGAPCKTKRKDDDDGKNRNFNESNALHRFMRGRWRASIVDRESYGDDDALLKFSDSDEFYED